MRWRKDRPPFLGTWVKLAVATAFEGAGMTRAVAVTRHLAFDSLVQLLPGRGPARRGRASGGARVHILGFHRVVDDLAALGPEVIPAMCIETASFERLLHIARDRFDVLALEDAAAVLAGTARAARDVLVITFDDAYRDVYLRALPVLRRLGLPATVFVPTGLIGSPAPLLHDRLHALLVRAAPLLLRDPGLAARPAARLLRRNMARTEGILRRSGPSRTVEVLIDELPADALRRLADGIEDLLGDGVRLDEGALVMTESELRACVDGGIALGAHTIEHVALVREPPARVRQELLRPRRELEAISGRPCRTFAYCNGLWTDRLRATVREAGYVAAVTTADRPNQPGDDLLLLGRKMLWEGHVRAHGRFSPALAAAQLHDLFGLLGLSRGDGRDGRREGVAEIRARGEA